MFEDEGSDSALSAQAADVVERDFGVVGSGNDQGRIERAGFRIATTLSSELLTTTRWDWLTEGVFQATCISMRYKSMAAWTSKGRTRKSMGPIRLPCHLFEAPSSRLQGRTEQYRLPQEQQSLDVRN